MTLNVSTIKLKTITTELLKTPREEGDRQTLSELKMLVNMSRGRGPGWGLSVPGAELLKLRPLL